MITTKCIAHLSRPIDLDCQLMPLATSHFEKLLILSLNKENKSTMELLMIFKKPFKHAFNQFKEMFSFKTNFNQYLRNYKDI